MGKLRRSWKRVRRSLIRGGLTAGLLLPLGSQLAAAAEVLPAMAAEAREAARPVELAECLRIALAQQPALDAYRASLASAETNRRAVQNIKVPALLVRELPYRREQATLGVTSASANLEKAEHETRYAVIRLYYSVIFAREQKHVADSVVEHLQATLKTAKDVLAAGSSRDVTQSTVDKITVYYRLAQTRQADAERGIERATAALREALGIGADCCIRVADATLPERTVQLCRGDIIDLAIARRPEIVLAVTASEVTCLEIKAQGTKLFAPQASTFASASDLHANPVPQGHSNGEYRPGAVGPEMPVTLVGSRRYRTERARDLYARSSAVIDKTRHLITLDAENSFLKWEEASKKVPQTREAKETGRKLADDTRKNFIGGQKVKAEDVLANEVLAAQAEAQFNEALYNLVLSLADLERVTAGGFSSGLGAAH